MINPQKCKFILDSDTFIRSARFHYAFDFAKPFWDGLLKFAEQGLICSIDKVKNELLQGNDELAIWVKNIFSPYFFKTDNYEIITAYAQIIRWAQNQSQFNQTAKDDFMDENKADAWLISFALVNQLTIVTHEVYNKEIKKKIPIPNVCEAFGIRYIDIYQMLRELEFQF